MFPLFFLSKCPVYLCRSVLSESDRTTTVFTLIQCHAIWHCSLLGKRNGWFFFFPPDPGAFLPKMKLGLLRFWVRDWLHSKDQWVKWLPGLVLCSCMLSFAIFSFRIFEHIIYKAWEHILLLTWGLRSLCWLPQDLLPWCFCKLYLFWSSSLTKPQVAPFLL